MSQRGCSFRACLISAPFQENDFHCKHLLGIRADNLNSIPLEAFPALEFLDVKMVDDRHDNNPAHLIGRGPTTTVSHTDAFRWLEKQEGYKTFIKPVAETAREFRMEVLVLRRCYVANRRGGWKVADFGCWWLNGLHLCTKFYNSAE